MYKPFFAKERFSPKILHILSGRSLFHTSLNPIQDGLFRGCSRMGGGGKKSPLSKICHTYPTLMKLGTVTRYLKKIQKIHKSRDTPSEFC